MSSEQDAVERFALPPCREEREHLFSLGGDNYGAGYLYCIYCDLDLESGQAGDFVTDMAQALEASQQENERLEQAVGWCQWGPTEDGGYNYFETSCGRSYFVVEGTLAENEYQHCPGCGGAIEEGTQDEQ